LKLTPILRAFQTLQNCYWIQKKFKWFCSQASYWATYHAYALW